MRFNRLREDGKTALQTVQEKTTIKQLLLDSEEGFNVQEKGMKRHTV